MNKVIIDVREPFEYAMGHVKGSLNIPPSKLMKGAAKLDGVAKDAEIIVYCRSGARSAVAMNILQKLGYSNVTNGINKEHVKAKHL